MNQPLSNAKVNPKSDIHTAVQWASAEKYIVDLMSNGFTSKVWHPYCHSDGTLIYMRLRLRNPQTGEKKIIPISKSHDGYSFKEPDWDKNGFSNGKPIYGLEKLAKFPSAAVYIVEGELVADTLNDFFAKNGQEGNFIAITTGAATSATKADLTTLAGRQVIIWPDNDSAGNSYANEITTLLYELKCSIEWVSINELNLPEKADFVDWLNLNPDANFEKFNLLNKAHPIHGELMEPLFDIAEASVGQYLLTAPPPRKYLLEQCLPIGKTGLLVGMGGVRKSQLMLELQISIATGEPLCGYWHIGEKGATLGLFAEEDNEEIHRRLFFSTEKLSKSDKTLIKERVFIKSMLGLNNQMVTKQDYSGVQMTDFIGRLILTAKQISNLKLIILDPASRFRGGDENSSADTTRFVEACEIVAKETGATVLIVHHVNKTSISASEANQAAARGSSALTDGVRWQMNLNVMSIDAAKKFGIQEDCRKSYVSAEVTKNNYAPPQQAPVWIELTKPHGILKYVELATTGENKKIEITSKIIEKIKENANKGLEHSKSGFVNAYSGTDNIFKTGDKSLRGLIEQALEDGLLVFSPPKVPIKNVTSVLVVAHQEVNFNGAIEDLIAQL